MTGDFRVIEVASKKDLRRFIKFPDELYKDCPQYVPALHKDQVISLTKCATSRYCPHKMWMAVDEKGSVVGRICAMINPRYNEMYGKKRVRFGWFDIIDNLDVARLLLDTAEAWGKENGMTEIHGPLYYNTLGKQGMLIEGFENTPPFNCIYNFPYYVDYVTALGFEKECDWLQYEMISDKGVPEKVSRIASMLKERYNLHEGSIENLKKDKKLVRHFFDVYNESFAKTVYNFVPFTDEEIEEEAASVMPLLSDKTSVIIMDENNELAAFGICFPTMSEALKKAKGSMFPFGWYHMLKAMNNLHTVDLMINGAVPKWQNTGISAVVHCAMSERCLKYGTHLAIANPQIESNSAVNVWSKYDNKLFMRRRCYIKEIK